MRSLVVLALTIIIASIAIPISAASNDVSTTELKLGLYRATCFGVLEYPRWGSPALAIAGKSFTIIVNSGVSIRSVVAIGLNKTYKLKIVSVNGTRIEVLTPKGMKPGIYDMVVSTNDGKRCIEHAALWVVKELPKTLVLMHVSDTHFGVINPSGIPAEDYVLAATIIANSLDNVSIVAITGDIADTGSEDQYLTARLILWMLRKPVFIAPGNHDHVSGEVNYLTYVGPLLWSTTVGNYTFIAFDTGYEGYLGTVQAKKVVHMIETAKGYTILLFHHPLFSYVYGSTPHEFRVSSWEELYKLLKSKKPNSRWPYIYTSWLENEESLKTLIKAMYESRTILALSGHIHLDSYAVVYRENGLPIHFVVTTACGGPVRSRDYHGFRLIVINGSDVRVLGQDVPWSRHASFDLDRVFAKLVINNNAIGVAFRISDAAIYRLLKHLVLSIPIPFNVSEYHVYAPNASRVWVECSATVCTMYAEIVKPIANSTYVLVYYKKPDKEAPRIQVIEAPSRVSIAQGFTLKYKVSDDSWGVIDTYVIEEANGEIYKLKPLAYGSTYIVNIVPASSEGTIKLRIVAVDLSGKKSVKDLSIEVVGATSAITTTTSKTAVSSTQTITSSRTSTTSTTTTYTKVEHASPPVVHRLTPYSYIPVVMIVVAAVVAAVLGIVLARKK